MKKVVILSAALALFAVPAFAGIQGTGHETASCTGCHVPHSASTSITNGTGPFLARAIDGATDVNGMCIGCHDAAGSYTYGSAAVGIFGALADAAAYTTRSTGATKTDHPIGALSVDSWSGTVACTSCHAPHNEAGAANALLIALDMNPVCGGCHDTKW